MAKKATGKTSARKKATTRTARTAAAKPKAAKTARKAGAKTERKPVTASVISRPMVRPPRPRVVDVPPPVIAPTEPVDSGLTPEDLAEFRQLLLDKRAEIMGDVSTLTDEAQNKTGDAGNLSSMPIHMADLGTDNYEHEFTLGLIEGRQQLVREIDEALERIAKGTYGICVATGKPIGKGRLRAEPWAKYCYEYKLAQEGRKVRRF